APLPLAGRGAPSPACSSPRPLEPSATSRPRAPGALEMTMTRILGAVAALAVGLGALGCGGSEQVVTYESGLRIELRGNRIYINQTIEFEHDSAVLLPSASPILDALAEVLGNRPEIYRVQIQGHSSTDGD